MGDGGGGNNWSHKTSKAPVKMSPLTKQRSVFLQAGSHSCRPTNRVKARKGKNYKDWKTKVCYNVTRSS